MWWRQAALALNGTAGVRALGKGSPSYTARLPTPIGRSVQQGVTLGLFAAFYGVVDDPAIGTIACDESADTNGQIFTPSFSGPTMGGTAIPGKAETKDSPELLPGHDIAGTPSPLVGKLLHVAGRDDVAFMVFCPDTTAQGPNCHMCSWCCRAA